MNQRLIQIIFNSLHMEFFQSEGAVSAKFTNPMRLEVSPVVSIGQNYSPESLAFFVRLYHELGRQG